MQKLLKLTLLAALLLGGSGPARAESWAIEAGSGFAFVYPHPQLKLWYRLTEPFELGLGWSTGINNYEVWSQNLALQAKYSLALHPQLRPFATLGAGLSLFEPGTGWQARPSLGLGLGLDWMFCQQLGLAGAVQFMLADPYSSAPFVFRPEINLRYLF